jgi:hypothetical protein
MIVCRGFMVNLVPTWIKERENADAWKSARTEAENQRQLAAALRIQKDGPAFLDQLFAEFTINTNAMRNLKFQRGTAPLSLSPSTEAAFRISEFAPSNFPTQTYPDFLYAKGQNTSLFWMLNGEVHTFRLCVWEETVRAIWDEHETPLTAKELAEAITKRMVDSVDRN